VSARPRFQLQNAILRLQNASRRLAGRVCVFWNELSVEIPSPGGTPVLPASPPALTADFEHSLPFDPPRFILRDRPEGPPYGRGMSSILKE